MPLAWALLVWEQGAWSYRYADWYLSTLRILVRVKQWLQINI